MTSAATGYRHCAISTPKDIGLREVIIIKIMKYCKLLLPFVLCCLFCKCQMVSKDVEYTIEHKGQTIIVQRILGNATSANYIQVIINGERVANIREESIIIDHVECNDSVVVIYKKNWSDEIDRKCDTLFISKY